MTEKFKERMQELDFLTNTLNEHQNKMIKLEERFINDEIPNDLYTKYIGKFKEEEIEIKQKIHNLSEISSNIEVAVKKGLKIAQDIGKIWLSSDYDHKSKLQNLVFPEGILYDRQKHEVRTPRVNTLFLLITIMTSVSGAKKIDQSVKTDRSSRLVARTGIEPVIPP